MSAEPAMVLPYNTIVNLDNCHDPLGSHELLMLEMTANTLGVKVKDLFEKV